jgi:hypothetical protein
MDFLTRLSELMRSLGNAGACENAAAMLDGRRHEDWLVNGLTRRLGRMDRHAIREADAA